MNLSASIVTYNDQAEALRAAASVLEHTRRHPLTLYLVDNASTDGTGAGLEAAAAGGRLAAGPQQTVRVIRKRRIQPFQRIRQENVIGIIEYQILAAGMSRRLVFCRGISPVFLINITYVGKLFPDHFPGSIRGTIVHYNNFKIAEGLASE